MAKVHLAKRARKDLIEIRRFTVKRRGKAQAGKYIVQIHRCAEELASQHLKGKLRENITPNLKSYHVGRHVIFYVDSKEGIEIARVLHDSMDFLGTAYRALKRAKIFSWYMERGSGKNTHGLYGSG